MYWEKEKRYKGIHKCDKYFIAPRSIAIININIVSCYLHNVWCRSASLFRNLIHETMASLHEISTEKLIDSYIQFKGVN